MFKDTGKRIYGQFNISYPPIIDGVAEVVKNYTLELNNLGDLCYALVPKAKGYRDVDAREGIPGIIRCSSLSRLRAKPYVIPLADPVFRTRVSKIPFDLIHIHYPILLGNYALNLARRKGIPVVATFHTRYREQLRRVWPEPWADKLSNYITRFYEKANEVWVPTMGAGEILREYGYRGRSLQIVPNGTDLAIPGEEEYRIYREKGLEMLSQTLEKPQDAGDAGRPVFLYIGNMLVTKNLKLLLEALAYLKQKNKPFLMLMVGEGYYRPGLEEYAKKEGLENQVLFLGSLWEREKIKALLAVSDLFLFPSKADTAGIVRLEAAAYGVPLVVVRERCAVEGIVDGVNGFISEDTAEDYGEKLLFCLNHPEEVRRAGLKARETLYRSWKEVVSHVRARYGEILSSFPKKG